MKRKLLYSSALLLSLLLTMKANKASAQITGVTVNAQDSNATNSCAGYTSFSMSIWGNITGSVSMPNDSVTLYINYGDGYDTTFKAALSGTVSAYYSSYVGHLYLTNGTFQPHVTVTTSNNLTQTTIAGYAVQVSTSCATLSGTVYKDNNSNCTYDAGTDAPLAYALVTIHDNTLSVPNYYTSTDSAGHYSFNLYPGDDYTIMAWPYYWYYGLGYLSATCPTSDSITIASAGSGPYTENFGFACTGSSSNVDAYTYGYSCTYQPGYDRVLSVLAGSYTDCFADAGTVTLTLDSHLSYVGMVNGPTPSSVSGNVITWNSVSLNDSNNFFSQVDVHCDASTPLGDSLCNTVALSSLTYTDPDLNNNTATFCNMVTNSFDPNNKSVYPRGTGSAGYIANGTPLHYNIEFQNTGNAPAVNITVVDTLNSNVDPGSLVVDKTSKPMKMYIYGNLVKFVFSNINLADSSNGVAASTGYIAYTVKPRLGLAAGTQIMNTAHIYFDYNDPINTNATLNTIEGPSGVQQLANSSMNATVYPNPANDEVTVKTNDQSDFNVSMTDILGRTISSQKSIGGKTSINTSSVPAGIYVIKITGANGGELTTKLNVLH